ncbi:hypothetical protein HPB50_017827 [Hyalomma asiaticum]|uniref:Uncharacterized protein n=1 Tax=Hyalomma asiaticum TaxID=266040 RepID=A0ACB7T3G2_HYAAI|nr:hypothetical protein HPB50_017827 [Hyalomma asiaticum]
MRLAEGDQFSGCPERRASVLFLTDRESGVRFLVVTGVEVSVGPPFAVASSSLATMLAVLADVVDPESSSPSAALPARQYVEADAASLVKSTMHAALHAPAFVANHHHVSAPCSAWRGASVVAATSAHPQEDASLSDSAAKEDEDS